MLTIFTTLIIFFLYTPPSHHLTYFNLFVLFLYFSYVKITGKSFVIIALLKQKYTYRITFFFKKKIKKVDLSKVDY